jgi:hypothetical protein
MKTFVKNYIGKGKQVAGLSIDKVTCKVEDLVKYAYEYDGVEYVTLEVAKIKTSDNFGRDYSVYVSQKEEAIETKSKRKDAAPSRKSVKKPKKISAMVKKKIYHSKEKKTLMIEAFFVVALQFSEVIISIIKKITLYNPELKKTM